MPRVTASPVAGVLTVALSIASLANALLAAKASRPTPRKRNSQPSNSFSSISFLTLSAFHSWLAFSNPSVVMITITFSSFGKRSGGKGEADRVMERGHAPRRVLLRPDRLDALDGGRPVNLLELGVETGEAQGDRATGLALILLRVRHEGIETTPGLDLAANAQQ